MTIIISRNQWQYTYTVTDQQDQIILQA